MDRSADIEFSTEQGGGGGAEIAAAVSIAPHPTGSTPRGATSSATSIGQWWAAALSGELRAPAPRLSPAASGAIQRHRTEDDASDPLIVPSEWGVF